MNTKLEYPAENIGRQFREISRRTVSGTVVETEYRAGYTTITVKSTFGTEHCLAGLIGNIAEKKMARGAVV